jgi:hypothetical protein
MLEKNVEAALVRGVKRRRAIAPKGEKLGKGWPDRIVLAYPGKIAFVELKRVGGTPRRRQILIGKLLRSLGFTHVFLYTVDEVEAWLNEWFGD